MLKVVLIFGVLLEMLCANPSYHNGKTARQFKNTIAQQNMQMVVTSIEERLRNLDNIYASQNPNGLDNRLAQLARRLEMIESKLTQMEETADLKLDSITENISSKLLKENLQSDHIFRKLDNMYERMNNRLTYADSKFDTISNMIQDKLEHALNKIIMINENLISRLMKVELEVTEVATATHDYKDYSKNVHAKIEKLGEHFKKCEVNWNDYKTDIYMDVSKSINNIDENVSNAKNEVINLDNSFNEFTNKVSEMMDVATTKNNELRNSIDNAANSLNTTRNDMLNNFRALMLQLGKSDNKNILSDSSGRIQNLTSKLDDYFETVMYAQNSFMENCHRVQMDETQMESEIGNVLQKMLDSIEAQRTEYTQGIRKLDGHLRSHDNAVRRNMHQIQTTITTNELLVESQLTQIINKLDSNAKIVVNSTYDHNPKSSDVTECCSDILNDLAGILRIMYNVQSNLVLVQNSEIKDMAILSEKMNMLNDSIARIGSTLSNQIIEVKYKLIELNNTIICNETKLFAMSSILNRQGLQLVRSNVSDMESMIDHAQSTINCTPVSNNLPYIERDDSVNINDQHIENIYNEEKFIEEFFGKMDELIDPPDVNSARNPIINPHVQRDGSVTLNGLHIDNINDNDENAMEEFLGKLDELIDINSVPNPIINPLSNDNYRHWITNTNEEAQNSTHDVLRSPWDLMFLVNSDDDDI